jgi:hypothetical protein
VPTRLLVIAIGAIIAIPAIFAAIGGGRAAGLAFGVVLVVVGVVWMYFDSRRGAGDVGDD